MKLGNLTTITPYKDQNISKKGQVSAMFNGIARHYDFLNRFMSLGIDRTWRIRAVKELKRSFESQNRSTDFGELQILDMATGTGDLAIAIAENMRVQVMGCDIAQAMLDRGAKKINRLGLDHLINLRIDDSEELSFDNETFDGVTCAFGVRNFEDLHKGLTEALRVLVPGGSLVILEFSKPRMFPMKQIFHFYFNYFMPRIGSWISHDRSAYKYLSKSVQQFPEGSRFVEKLEEVGFTNVTFKPLTFRVCTVYTAVKSA